MHRPSRTVYALVLLAVLAALALAGCGGDHAGPASLPAAAVSASERIAAMNLAEAKLQSLTGTPAQQNAALASYMQTLTQFRNVRTYGPGGNRGVYAEFRDGQPYYVSNERNIANVTPVLTQAAAETVGTAARSGVPRGKTAILMRAMGSGWPDTRNDTKAMLIKAGYNVVLKDGTIEAIRGLRNAAVFYFDTHGTYDSDSGSLTASAWTTTPVTTANETTYAADLSSGGLVRWSAYDYYDTTSKKWKISKKYAVTSKFIADNGITFGSNSLVYMDCCFLDAAPFKAACTAAGASLYIGWTDAVAGSASARAARFVFDRLTGANSSATVKEDPKQRPFDYVKVWDDLKRLNYDVSGAAKLIFTPGAKGDAGMLAPSIRNIVMTEATELDLGIAMMEIKGLFGKDPGPQKRKVTVGGTMIQAYEWKPDAVKCVIPRFGQGSVGDVIVVACEHKSNAVPLTEWTVPFVWTRTSFGNLRDVMRMNIHFRADVHSYRNKPHETPVKPTAVEFKSMVDSDGTWLSAGAGTDNTNEDNPIKLVWSGSGNMYNQTPRDPRLPYGALRAYGKINVETRTIQFTVAGSATVKHVDCTNKDGHHWEADCGVSNEDGLPYDAVNNIGVPYVRVKFDENFRILSGSVTGTNPDHPEETLTLKWSAADASFPPLPDMTLSDYARLLGQFWSPV